MELEVVEHHGASVQALYVLPEGYVLLRLAVGAVVGSQVGTVGEPGRKKTDLKQKLQNQDF